MTQSYNFDSQGESVLLEGERLTSKGNIIALACGPLKRKRYVNPKIELELLDFKKEIEEKFEKSPLRRFIMPKRSTQVEQPLETTGIFTKKTRALA